MITQLTIVFALLVTQQGQQIERAVDVKPDTVTVGDPFSVSVRIRAPLGSVIEFPAGPDSISAVRLLDPMSVRTIDSVQFLDQVASYRMAAWDVNQQPIFLDDVVVRTASGVQRVQLVIPRVMVQTVLPADSALRVPKPARDIFELALPWWFPWVPLLVLAALLGWVSWWYFSRRRARQTAFSPLQLAEKAFERVEAMRLVEAGERGRYVALMVDVMREFLVVRVVEVAPSQTSTEMLLAVRGRDDLPLDRLRNLLHEADLVKFARRPLSNDTARRLGREAREIVRSIGNPPPPEESQQKEAA